jgi:hypothetical protein
MATGLQCTPDDFRLHELALGAFEGAPLRAVCLPLSTSQFHPRPAHGAARDIDGRKGQHSGIVGWRHGSSG